MNRSVRLQMSRDHWCCCRFAPYFFPKKMRVRPRSFQKKYCRHIIADGYFLKFHSEVA